MSLQIIEVSQALTSEVALKFFQLDKQFFPTPWGHESWKNLFHVHNPLLMALIHDSGPVGFCLFDKVPADSFAHLLKILIHPEFRSRGLAKNLLNAALIKLEEDGYSQFFLEVEEDNFAAQKLYLAMGFKIIHRKKDFYGVNRSALIMTRVMSGINKSHS